MSNPSTDLESALDFVVNQIETEAERSGAPLDDGEKDYLRNLPTKPTNPELHVGAHRGFSGPVLRDFDYERLCTLANDARAHDVRLRPEASRQWDFACAILQFHHHPMSWLLGWAGINVKKARGFSDGCLLLVTALLIIVLSMLGIYALSTSAAGYGEIWRRVLWITAALTCIAILAALYFATKRLERWQDGQTVEKYRTDFPNTGSKTI